MTNDDLNKFRGIVKEEINTALEVSLKPIKNTLAEHTEILNKHTQMLDKHTERLDALWEETAKLSVLVSNR